MEYRETFVVGGGFDRLGIHARSAGAISKKVCELEEKFEGIEFFMTNNGKEVEAWQIYEILSLGLRPKIKVDVCARYFGEGKKEELICAVKEVGKLIENPRSKHFV